MRQGVPGGGAADWRPAQSSPARRLCGAKLLELYEGGAHRALGYSSWGAYYEAEFGASKSEGYRLLDAARVVESIPNVGNGLPRPQTVHHAQALVPVLRDNPERVEEVWAEVVEEHGP